uniref:DUF4605 domain-containing protein n=1 Tax=Parascaris univalens TaxID=6257 RepID=A0A915BFQ5_PARUN
MVRITSTGDIVNDEETPVRHRGPSRQSNNTISLRRNNGDIANTNLGHSNPWSVVNARLSEYGIPTYSLYGYKFEPIHFVFTLAALILFGVQSLLLIPILLIVSNLSNPSVFPFIQNSDQERTFLRHDESLRRRCSAYLLKEICDEDVRKGKLYYSYRIDGHCQNGI